MSDFKAKIPLGSLRRSPDPLAVFKGPTSKGTEGKGRERKGWGRKAMSKGREGGEGGGRKGRGGREGNEGVHLTYFAFRTLAALLKVSGGLNNRYAIYFTRGLRSHTHTRNLGA